MKFVIDDWKLMEKALRSFSAQQHAARTRENDQKKNNELYREAERARALADRIITSPMEP